MISILLVGVGGYGGLIAQEVLDNGESHGCRVVGVVEPFLQNSPVRDKINGIPVFSDIKEFYKEYSADLAIISTPIHLHKEQAVLAMEMGSDVLCEKPVAPTLQDAHIMEECSIRTGRRLNIGFQLSHAPSVLEMKRDIAAGRFGACLSGRAMICWPRNDAYFSRPWAAKAKIDGRWVLDSIMMNACAHYLHNMLFLLGDGVSSAARAEKLGLSLYRANDIETYDTVFAKIFIKNDVELSFMASHATEKNVDPVTVLHFEKADIYITEKDGDEGAYAVLKSGERLVYGATYKDRFKKIWHAVDVFKKEKEPVCTVRTALEHLKIVNAASEFFKVEGLESIKNDSGVNVVQGLDDMMLSAFSENVMPPLYKPERIVDISEYSRFGGLFE